MLIDTRIAVVGLSLTGAFLLACTGVLVKAGLRYSDVRQSVLVSFGANALVAALAVLLVRPAVEVPARAVLLFIGDGVLSLLAVYAALGRGMVSVVVPIYTSSPLFVLPLSALFLRDVERVTLRKVLGAAAIVLGVVLVSLY